VGSTGTLEVTRQGFTVSFLFFVIAKYTDGDFGHG